MRRKGRRSQSVGPFACPDTDEHHARTHPTRYTHKPAKSGHAPDQTGEPGMILIGRVGQIEMYLDDEIPEPIGYNPEYLEDIARRLGRQAVAMYTGIPDEAKHPHTADDEAD